MGMHTEPELLLSRIRREKGLSQRKLAVAANTTEAMMSKLERGRAKPPPGSPITARVAAALGYTGAPDDLLAPALDTTAPRRRAAR